MNTIAKSLAGMILTTAFLGAAGSVNPVFAFSITPEEKMLAITSYVANQDTILFQSFLDKNVSTVLSSDGMITSDLLSLDLEGSIDEIDFSSNYKVDFDLNSNTVSWTMTGIYDADNQWRSFGSAEFLNNDEEVLLAYSSSINAEFSILTGLEFAFGGGRPPTISGSLRGIASDNINQIGRWSSDVRVTIEIDGDTGEIKTIASIGGDYTETERNIQKIVRGRLEIQSDGRGRLRVEGGAKTVPTPALLPGLMGIGVAAIRKRNEV
ncbi:PTPA-CTERM sorting domain-containing protein [Leptolyngbyaceae cyanobacterium CCMR0082]|uniref:PTPA-CTERM sorting domain-containing protein n=1 Tax=Adonisia turfae CCMR0082 TaxID=2304604 RepID=A0A6M0SII1_9CYAN|nr:PTPA-CTERM sorting domain-containing protein [Adonisia turfae]NEZ68389.1 PTPA-CTERM sorting domain-containing protein [Adonisia turfae CCMR0082]